MKKTITLFFVAALMLPIALAAPSVDFNVTPREIDVNQQYTVTIVARDPDGVDSIIHADSRSTSPCGGLERCERKFNFVQSRSGEFSHRFLVRGVDNEVTERAIVVAVGQGASGTNTTLTFTDVSEGGAVASSGDMNFQVSVVGGAVVNRPFTIKTIASDSDGIDSISYFNTDIEPDTWVTSPCGGMENCERKWHITETEPGQHTYRFVARDATGQNRLAEFTVTIASGTGNITTPPIGAVIEDLGVVRVTVSNGGPIAEATVSLVGDNVTYAGVTGQDGVAVFQVEAGCYDVTVEKTGQSFESKRVCVEAAQTQDVAIGVREAAVGAPLPWMYILAAIIAIAVVGGGVYYYMQGDTHREEGVKRR